MHSEVKRPLIFGEVLFDCFSDGSRVLGGAPFNVAWNLHQLGENPLLISRVGRDALGDQIIEVLSQSGFDTTGIQVDSDFPTGQVGVTLIDGEAHYFIPERQAFDFISSDQLPDLGNTGILYHGTLGVREATAKNTLQELKRMTAAEVLIDVNLRRQWDQDSGLTELIKKATWCKLNADEFIELSQVVFGLEKSELSDKDPTLKEIFSGKSLSGVLVTNGAKGAKAILRNSSDIKVAPPKKISVVDTVGAGDAFCSVMLLGIVRGWEIEVTLQRAQEFASGVVGLKGATTTESEFYSQYKQQWLA